MSAKVAVLIVARNAEKTVQRALDSALSEPIDELVFVDDVSEDRTLEIVQSTPDPRLRILALEEHRTLGYARGRGLELLQSEYCFLLDADDSFLPGRIERLVTCLESSNSDFVADEIELVDGQTEKHIREIPIPDFLDEPPGLLRLFERNYLPGIGQIGFRVESMQCIGYDPAIHGTEDSDLVLRAIASGRTGSLVRETGYRMRHYPTSVSRDRSSQADNLAATLKKHSVETLRAAILKTGVRERIVDWILYSHALFQRDYESAGAVLEKLAKAKFDPEEVLEPRGPCPLPESWRIAFANGTLGLLRENSASQSGEYFKQASFVKKTPDLLNNWGVALAKNGHGDEAVGLFREALALLPGYADARENLELGSQADRITSHLLRREASRSEY